MALWQVSTAGALCINTWVNPIALARIGYYYYILYIGILVYIILVACFTFPETKGLSLEEVSKRFDGAVGPLDGRNVEAGEPGEKSKVNPDLQEIEAPSRIQRRVNRFQTSNDGRTCAVVVRISVHDGNSASICASVPSQVIPSSLSAA